MAQISPKKNQMLAAEKQTPRSRQSWPWWRRALTGLSLVGLALSGYLGWHYLMGGPVIGCGGDSPCEQVLSSQWSAIGGVLPVSGLAEGAYLAILVATFFIGPATETPIRRLAWRAMLVLVGAAAGSAVWFIFVQKRYIGAFCPYCMATHITGLLLSTLVIWRAPKALDGESTVATPEPSAVEPPTPPRMVGRLPAISLALGGLVLAGIMAVCQVAFPPKAVSRGGESQVNNLPTLDPHAVPLVGSPDARYVVTLCFDYKCPHCQRLHALLDEVIHRYNGKVAFALCPAPLNPDCNPYISRNTDEFTNSCELAKIGLAVWVAKREAFPDFDRWMFSPEPGHLWHPRSLEAATAKAVELVGQAKFDAAQVDPWVDQYLQTSVRIYGGTGGTAVPKLVFGARWETPEPNNAEDLLLILHNRLALPEP